MNDILDRWGLIADYLKVSEKTAMRYKERGAPISSDDMGHPITTRQALDQWKRRNLPQESQSAA